jgi:hypothetical protein
MTAMAARGRIGLKNGLAVLAVALAAVSGCGRKPPNAALSSKSSGATTYTSYAGTWKGYLTKTAETADCKADTDGSLTGPEVVTVTSTGAFSGSTGEYSGLISDKGIVKGTFSDGITCGEGPWTGTCFSQTMCSGTFVSYGVVHDRVVQGESGTWIMTR